MFRPGHNCWRVAHADRATLLIDAAAYFDAFARAAQRATRSILILGWDFHGGTRLHLAADVPGPDRLGDFLCDLARRRRELEVRILVWDFPALFAKGRERRVARGLAWRPRVRIHYDEASFGASHHQKIVVIDDAVAFCGGLDLTRARWDTSAHRAFDPRRADISLERGTADGSYYPPFHDVMMAVDGEAARALGQLARERWRRATGEALRASEAPARGPGARARTDTASSVPVPWPPALAPQFTGVDVAIARTCGGTTSAPRIREVEALHLDLIAAARRHIYIENQYFSARRLGEALAARLAEPDGPEVIAVLRRSTRSWLEAPTMGAGRDALLARLRAADRHGRFHAYYPHLPGQSGGEHCDLHSKLMVIDEEILRVGSANFCNRSMSVDSECDVALQARRDPLIERQIRGALHALLAEHLGVEPAAVSAAHAACGSLAGTIAALSSAGRSLRALPAAPARRSPRTLLSAAWLGDPGGTRRYG